MLPNQSFTSHQLSGKLVSYQQLTMLIKVAVVLAVVAVCVAWPHHGHEHGHGHGHGHAVSHQNIHRHDGPGHLVTGHEHGGHHGHHGGTYHDYHAHPAYKYDYSVHDPHTGDKKSQWESRDGDVVKGEYALVEPDGSHRSVHYNADHHGFHAHVSRSQNIHPTHYGHHHHH